MNPAIEYPILPFKTVPEWNKWLEKNHNISSGVWVRFFKKNTNIPTITYSEALDEALCYGWIDSQTKKYDEISYLQKFTPRRKKSIWSKINTENIERLVKTGKMKPAGLKQIEEAKADGRWGNAYQSPSHITLPENFLEALSQDKEAKSFFDTLNKAYTYAISWRIQTAKKPETRQKRIESILAMLKKREKFH